MTIKEQLNLAWKERVSGNYVESRKWVDKVIEKADREDYKTLGRSFHILRQIESDQGNLEKAIEYSRESIKYYKNSGSQTQIAHSVRHLADLEREVGNTKSSLDHYGDALSIYRESDHTHPLDLANTLRGYAIALEIHEPGSNAIEVWKEVRTLYSQLNLQEGVDEADENLNRLS